MEVEVSSGNMYIGKRMKNATRMHSKVMNEATTFKISQNMNVEIQLSKAFLK